MRKIKYFDDEFTADEWVRREVCKNAGACRDKSRVVRKEELLAWCEEKGIAYKKSATKEMLLDLLIENGCSYEEVAVKFEIGVTSREYKNSFGLSQEEVKALEESGVLSVIALKPFKHYGFYRSRMLVASIYDLYQYCRMTDEDMKILLEEYLKAKPD